jgi:hypothetical protein
MFLGFAFKTEEFLILSVYVMAVVGYITEDANSDTVIQVAIHPKRLKFNIAYNVVFK